MTTSSLLDRLSKLEERSNHGLAVVFINEHRPGFAEAVAEAERLRAVGRRLLVYRTDLMDNSRPTR